MNAKDLHRTAVYPRASVCVYISFHVYTVVLYVLTSLYVRVCVCVRISVCISAYTAAVLCARIYYIYMYNSRTQHVAFLVYCMRII